MRAMELAVLATCGIRRPELASENPPPVFCSLLIPQRKSTISSIDLLIFTEGNRYCAEDSHLHHAVDKLLSSVAPPPLHRLDQTRHHLAPARNTDRLFQEHVRPCDRKRTLASTTHHPASTGETTCLYQDGPAAPGASGGGGAHLEASAVHRSARDAAAMASPGLQALVEIQVQSHFCHTQDLC